MKKTVLMLLTLVSIFTLAGCQSDDLEKELDDLKNELEVKEQIWEQLADDIIILQDTVEELNQELQAEKEKNAEASLLISDYLEDIDLLQSLIADSDVQVISFNHINGEGYESEDAIVVLKEYSMRDYTAYQLTYLSCDSRPAQSNTYMVMYIEIYKETNDVKFISFDMDETNTYQVGLWGDSFTIPGGRTYQDFVDYYIPWLIGKTSDDLEGISVFTNEPYHGIINSKNIEETDFIDAFAGSSVSTNNMLRVVKEILSYHDNNQN